MWKRLFNENGTLNYISVLIGAISMSLFFVFFVSLGRILILSEMISVYAGSIAMLIFAYMIIIHIVKDIIILICSYTAHIVSIYSEFKVAKLVENIAQFFECIIRSRKIYQTNCVLRC